MKYETPGLNQFSRDNWYGPLCKSSEEGLSTAKIGNIKVDKSLKFVSFFQGKRPKRRRHFSLFRVLGE